jgi:transposase InsO family protein
LESETTKVLCSQWFRFVVSNGIVYRVLFGRNGEPNQLQMLAHKALREDIIKRSHGGMCGGHMGISKTCVQVKRRAYWLCWRADTVRYCRRCPECCSYHRGQLPKTGPLQPIVAGAPFERMSIDLTGPHSRTPRGSVYILTCVDVFTKWTEAFPIPNKEAAVVARVLVEQVFCRLGVPIALLSDNGNEVDSSIMREVCKLLDIDKLRTTFYKASTNAAIERFHRTLNSMIGKVVNEKQTDWDIWLPYIMAAYRSTRHDTTGYSPNFLTLGREVRAPIDIVLGTGTVPNDGVGYDSFVESVRSRMQDAYELVRTHIGEAAVRNKRYYDVRVRPATYQVGQWVYYFNPRRYKGRQDKWSRKYTGPFCVVRVLGPVNIELQQTKRSRPFIVHIDKVKPYLGGSPKGWVANSDVEVVELNTQETVGSNEQPTHTESNEHDIATPVVQVTPEFVDVVTFNRDQEFRRTRPRRQVQLPARVRD